MSYMFADSLRASCSQAVSKHVWHTPLMCVQWKTPDDGQRNCPKHVEFHSKNKFEKLLHLVGFIVRNLSRCTVTWTSSYRHVSIDFCDLHQGTFTRVLNTQQPNYLIGTTQRYNECLKPSMWSQNVREYIIKNKQNFVVIHTATG